MKNLTGLFATGLILFLPACTGPEPGPHDKTVVISEVGEFLDAWTTAGKEGRYDDVKPFYSNDAGFAWIENGSLVATSNAEIAEGLDMAKDGNFNISLVLSDPEITPLSRTAAAVYAPYEFHMSAPSGPVADTAGMFTAVVVKEDGHWAFQQGHFSAPVSTPDAAEEPEIDEGEVPAP